MWKERRSFDKKCNCQFFICWDYFTKTCNDIVDVFIVVEFDDYAEIVDDDPDYAHPMAGMNGVDSVWLFIEFVTFFQSVSKLT